MLIMLAALSRVEGNAGFTQTILAFDRKVGRLLLSKGFDPENQLCTMICRTSGTQCQSFR